MNDIPLETKKEFLLAGLIVAEQKQNPNKSISEIYGLLQKERDEIGITTTLEDLKNEHLIEEFSVGNVFKINSKSMKHEFITTYPDGLEISTQLNGVEFDTTLFNDMIKEHMAKIEERMVRIDSKEKEFNDIEDNIKEIKF